MEIEPENPAAEQESRKPSRLRDMVKRVVLGYCAIVLILTFIQRWLIYHPTTANALPVSDQVLNRATAHDFTFQSTDKLTLHGWHFLRAGEYADNLEECQQKLSESPSVVVLFPGNAGNRSYRTLHGQMITSLDADFVIADYRGYGENEGSPSEENLISDAHALWAYLVYECGIPSDRIVLYGESLGGGVAVRLAADLCVAGTPPQALIVQSSFSSLGDVGQGKFPWLPVKLVLWDRFSSEAHMEHVNCPYLHLHGDQDEIVSFKIGKKLFASAPESSISGIDKQFVTLEGVGHNDVLIDLNGSITVQREIEKFLDRVQNTDENGE